MAVSTADIRETIAEIKESLLRLDGRLNVHDQKHVQLDKEHSDFSETIRQHSARLAMVENLSVKNERDVEKLTGTLSKLVWVIVTPLIGTLVVALIVLAGMVTK